MPSPPVRDVAPAPTNTDADIAKHLQTVFFYVKIVAKKDSTKHMFKSLVSRKHAAKPLDYNTKQEEKVSECYLKYQTHDQAKEVAELIKDEKINGAPFETVILEVDPQPTDSESDEPEPEENDKTEGDLSTHLNSDDSFDLNSDPGISSNVILQQVQQILSNEPIAAASMTKSRVLNSESSDEEDDEAVQVSRLIASKE